MQNLKAEYTKPLLKSLKLDQTATSPATKNGETNEQNKNRGPITS